VLKRLVWLLALVAGCMRKPLEDPPRLPELKPLCRVRPGSSHWTVWLTISEIFELSSSAFRADRRFLPVAAIGKDSSPNKQQLLPHS
jgi:hypothetical protein